MELTDSLKTLLIETAKSLKVSARREGVSQVWMLCERKHRNSWRFNM